jgi:hypothetical protein
MPLKVHVSATSKLHCHSHPNELQASMKTAVCPFMYKVDYLYDNASDNLSYLTFISLLIWDFRAAVETL